MLLKAIRDLLMCVLIYCPIRLDHTQTHTRFRTDFQKTGLYDKLSIRGAGVLTLVLLSNETIIFTTLGLNAKSIY